MTEPPPIDRSRLVCTSITGGIGRANRTVETTGLDVSVWSRPHDRADAGGDVHYVSSCASGRITRVVLADVAGHGSDAATRADQLRTAMQRSVNHVQHTGMVGRTNADFVGTGDDGRFATAIFVTYFLPTRSLRICNAGHPPPFRFAGERGRWESLDRPDDRNLPLGLSADQSFRDVELRLGPRDAVLLVTDGLIESRDERGEMLGGNGLAEWLGERPPSPQLVRDLHEYAVERAAGPVEDDLTIVLLQPNDRRIALKDNLLAPWRWLRGEVHHVPVETPAPEGDS